MKPMVARFADRSSAARQYGRVAVISSGGLADYTGGRRVVVAPGDEGSARRAAQGGRVKRVVPQPFSGKPVHRGRRHAAAEGAELAKPGVVDQDQYDVRRALGG